MTGDKIDQWLGNIGLFNRKKVYKMCHGGLNNHDDNFLITDHFFFMVHWLPKPFKIIPNLILLFFFCATNVLLFPILLISYIYFYFFELSLSRYYFFKCDKLIFIQFLRSLKSFLYLKNFYM